MQAELRTLLQELLLGQRSLDAIPEVFSPLLCKELEGLGETKFLLQFAPAAWCRRRERARCRVRLLSGPGEWRRYLGLKSGI